MNALHRFVALYAPMYAAFGVSSPFMPRFFQERGLAPEQLGILFAAGTAIRLVSAPLIGRLADLTRALRAVLAVCALLAALVALGLLSAPAFTPLLLTSLLHAAALAPTTVLADALTLGAAQSREARSRFEYGWVRGTGSAAFVIGTLCSGQVAGSWGLALIIVLQAALLLVAAGAAILVPRPERQEPVSVAEPAAPAGVVALLRMPLFRRVMLVSGLVLGSHAMHDTFAVIRWSEAGIPPAVASALWSVSVGAEIVVFFLVGPPLLIRLRPAGVLAVSAVAGIMRWVAMASSTSVMTLGAATARAHLRSAASGVYAPHLGDRPATPRRDGPGDVCARCRGDDCATDPSVRLALRNTRR
jgi:MFS transporter, PPP family, 3-phenylpropionic acid transporter